MTFATHSDRRERTVLVLAGLGVVAAAWLVPAFQYTVSWWDGAPGRIVLVAPLAWLVCAGGRICTSRGRA